MAKTTEDQAILLGLAHRLEQIALLPLDRRVRALSDILMQANPNGLAQLAGLARAHAMVEVAQESGGIKAAAARLGLDFGNVSRAIKATGRRDELPTRAARTSA